MDSLFNLISQQPDINKIYLSAKDPHGAKLQYLIDKRKSIGLKYLTILKVLLNTRIIWIIFIKTLKNRTQIKSVKY